MDVDWAKVQFVVQAVIDGTLVGTTYALIGIGFTLIFGVMHKLNLAFAAASIAGAFGSLLVWQEFKDLPVPLVFLASAAGSGVLGYAIYLTCFRFIPLKSPLATLMATVGMLIFLEEIVTQVSDGKAQNYPGMLPDARFSLGPLDIRVDYLLVFAISLVAMLLLLALLYRTRLGIATRAVAQQPVAAQLCGISLDRTNAATFVISGVLGGLAGAMIGSSAELLSNLLPLQLTVKGLIVTVIGGLGSIPGAIVAGLMVGAFEKGLETWNVLARDLAVMLLVFVFLVAKPAGIFGRLAVRD
jgi:branched-subunit amino acid ABC-type transport system permease component